jgi:hypothetical protein
VRYDVGEALPTWDIPHRHERGHLANPRGQPDADTTTARSNLIPADGQMPAAGICGRDVGPLKVITANPDTPSARCMIVTGSQHLRSRTLPTNSDIRAGQSPVSFAAFPPRQVDVGASTTFDPDLGSYLAPGVHILHISLYGGDSPDIWLR